MKKLLALLSLCPGLGYAGPNLPPTKNYGLFMQQRGEEKNLEAQKPSEETPPPTPETQPEPLPPSAPETQPKAQSPSEETPPPTPETQPEPPTPIVLPPLPQFFAAIRAGDINTISNFLTEGISPRVREHGSQGATALIAAVGARQEEMVKFLLEEGADVNASAAVGGIGGLSPLMVAAQGGTLPIVKILMDAGANVNAITRGASAGNTALMAAASSGQTAILGVLIASGANINVKNASGCSTLMISAQLGNIDALKILLKTPGIRTSDVDYHGNDALSFARRAGQKEAERIIYYTR